MIVDAGPRLCFSCPIDCKQFPTWFADLWNYSIVPYMLQAIREGVQVNVAYCKPINVDSKLTSSQLILLNYGVAQKNRPLIDVSSCASPASTMTP